ACRGAAKPWSPSAFPRDAETRSCGSSPARALAALWLDKARPCNITSVMAGEAKGDGMVEIIAVREAEDPRIQGYANIRERDIVGRQGRFIAEGKVVIELAAASARFQLESMLLLESRLNLMRDTLARLPADFPVLVVER